MSPVPNPVRLLILGIGLALARLGLLDRERAVRIADLSWPRVVTGIARMSKNAVDVAMVGVGVAPNAELAERAGIEPAEWDGQDWEGVFQPGERRGLGYASPAEPVDHPLRVVDVRRARSGDRATDAGAVLRDLAAWRPPRDLLTE